MPTQVGQTRGVSDVPIFYVPAGNEPYNIAAAFWQSFLGEKNWAARQLHALRLKALDPSQRAQALLNAYEAETDRINALNAAAREAEVTRRTVGPEILRLMGTIIREDAASSRTFYTGQVDILKAGAVLTSKEDRELQKRINTELSVYEKALLDKDETAQDQSLSAIRQAIKDAGPAVKKGAEANAFFGPLLDRWAAIGDAAGWSEDMTRQGADLLGMRANMPLEMPTRPGARGLGDVAREVDTVLAPYGLSMADTFGAGSSTSSSRSVSGRVPASPLPPGSEPDEEWEVPLEPDADAGARAKPQDEQDELDAFVGRPAATPAAGRPEGMGIDLTGEMQGLDWNPYGAFHEPLPGHVKPPRGMERRLKKMGPAEKIDLAEGVAARGSDRPEDVLSAVRDVRATRLEEAKKQKSGVMSSAEPDFSSGPVLEKAEEEEEKKPDALDDFIQFAKDNPKRAARHAKRAEEADDLQRLTERWKEGKLGKGGEKRLQEMERLQTIWSQNPSWEDDITALTQSSLERARGADPTVIERKRKKKKDEEERAGG